MRGGTPQTRLSRRFGPMSSGITLARGFLGSARTRSSLRDVPRGQGSWVSTYEPRARRSHQGRRCVERRRTAGRRRCALSALHRHQEVAERTADATERLASLHGAGGLREPARSSFAGKRRGAAMCSVRAPSTLATRSKARDRCPIRKATISRRLPPPRSSAVNEGHWRWCSLHLPTSARGCCPRVGSHDAGSGSR